MADDGSTASPASARGGADLASVLGTARERGFVGRKALLGWFDAAVGRDDGSRVLLLHGPGGIGKTALLEAFARACVDQARSWVYLDARDVAPSASAVEAALAERGGAVDDVAVLLIDGYDLLAPLGRWWHERLLPARPATSVTVLAGRAPPEDQWWLGPGWSRLVTVHELDRLDDNEGVELLAELGVPPSRREPMARLARGYPLALALLAETTAGGPLPEHLADHPDIVARLCARVIDDIPDAAHRTGLQTCTHATRMTHDLLRHTVGERADEVWSWLESRPYVRRGAVGLFVHDVVREAFEAAFAHQAPDSYASLHRRIRDYFLARIYDPREPRPDRAAAEILLLHRRTPLEEEVGILRRSGLPAIARAAVNEHEAIIELIEQGEGGESAALARRWLAEQPRSLYLVRSDDGVAAFAMQVYLPTGGGLTVDDPVTVAVREAVDASGPLRPGERINVNRFAGASRAYQRDPISFLVNGVSSILEWALEPAAWTFIITLEADLYGAYFECLGLRRMFVLDCNGRRHTGYGWDRRRFPPPALFEMMARRELTGETGPPPESLLRPAPLSPSDFADAVVAALRELARPERLTTSTLLTSNVMPPGVPPTPELLRHVVTDAIGSLTRDRRGADHARVLERTYLKGAPSQEAAAELLGLPFSTYRRHLSKAHERLTEVLWAVETGIWRPPDPESEQQVSSD